MELDLVKKIRKSTNHKVFDGLKSLNFEISSLVAREPSLELFYKPYSWWLQAKKKSMSKDPKTAIVNSQIDIVIEGFQGSANTFACRTFEESQTHELMILHHTHSPIQIIKATQLKIPVILTLRQPQDAVLSLTSRWPYISIDQGLRCYINFHRKLLPYANDFVISTFTETTQNFSAIIQEVNFRFKTEFNIPNSQVANKDFKKLTSDPIAASARKWISPKSIKESQKVKMDLLGSNKLIKNADAIYQDFFKIACDQRRVLFKSE